MHASFYCMPTINLTYSQEICLRATDVYGWSTHSNLTCYIPNPWTSEKTRLSSTMSLNPLTFLRHTEQSRVIGGV